VVYALPGVYGDHGDNSSKDILPIVMRERVHVKGVGANRCIIRGSLINQSFFPSFIFWPTGPTQGTNQLLQVLVNMAAINSRAPTPSNHNPPPWGLLSGGVVPDQREILSGFTFQGGAVQVYVPSGYVDQEQTAIVSNCVFDMRHGFSPNPSDPNTTLPGPYFGIMMAKKFLVNSPGYPDQKVLIANNTFIMGQWGRDLAGTEQWIGSARDEAVAVIDVTNPLCQGGGGDCDETLRGIGNPGLINNVFRTKPGTSQRALLGIDEDDTLIQGDYPALYLQTNAFAVLRNGSDGGNATFHSQAMHSSQLAPAANDLGFGVHPAIYGCDADTDAKNEACGISGPSCPSPSCTPATAPLPIVAIFEDSNTEYDPGFIGEYLSTQFPGLGSYVDWRLLPGSSSADSPLKDRGFFPATGQDITMKNGSSFPLSNFKEANPFEWDGEGYGNPRTVDASPDIGFDEIHLVNMAGSYGNYSSSHNVPSSLNPDALQGSTSRFLFFRRSAGGVDLIQSNELKINGANEMPTMHPPAWYRPPGTLETPPKDTSLPIGYRSKYISFRASPPAPWSEVIAVQTNFKSYSPLSHASATVDLQFGLASVIVDDECMGGPPCSETYFNTQVVFSTAPSPTGSPVLRSNLQAEFR